MQGHVEEVLELLHKMFGRTAIPFIEKFIVPGAERTGPDLFEIAVQRLGKLLVDIKNSKHLQKIWEQKQFGNNWEVKKEIQA